MTSILHRLFLLVVLATISGVLVVGCATEEPVPVPDELIGVWVTDDVRYEGRFLKLEAQKIHFGLGGDQASENPIINVETTREDGKSIYRIHYLSPEGLEYSQTLYYEPSSGEMRYKNRPSVVWKKVALEIEPAESAKLGLEAESSDSADYSQQS